MINTAGKGWEPDILYARRVTMMIMRKMDPFFGKLEGNHE